MLQCLTSWKGRLTSSKCQIDVKMALDSVAPPSDLLQNKPSDLLQNKSLNLTIGYRRGVL